jgi:hypothetical protein
MAHDSYQAEYRTQQAIEMRSMGVDYDFIAKELGYADRSGAWRAVKRGMLRKTSEDISSIRWQVCVDLTRMADAVEGYAHSGNLKAAHDVIKLVDRKLKVAGLV